MERIKISSLPAGYLVGVAVLYALVFYQAQDIRVDFSVNRVAISGNAAVYASLAVCLLLLSVVISRFCFAFLFKLRFPNGEMSVLYLAGLLFIRHLLPLVLLKGIKVDDVALISQYPGFDTFILFSYWYFLCVDLLIKWFGFSPREAFLVKFFGMSIPFSLKNYYYSSVLIKLVLVAFPLYRCYARIATSPLYIP